MNYFLPEAKISKDHGVAQYFKNYLIFPLYHPAAALRSTQVLKDLEADFKKLPEILKNPPPKPPPAPPKEEKTQNQESLF